MSAEVYPAKLAVSQRDAGGDFGFFCVRVFRRSLVTVYYRNSGVQVIGLANFPPSLGIQSGSRHLCQTCGCSFHGFSRFLQGLVSLFCF